MIVYYKLANILKERGMSWKDLCNSGIAANTPQKFSMNRNVNTDTIDKVCSFLGVQPGDIMMRCLKRGVAPFAGALIKMLKFI